jgi:fucose permease
MLAIFIYVGTEVTIISNCLLYYTVNLAESLEDAILVYRLVLGSLMIGRWNGGVNAF